MVAKARTAKARRRTRRDPTAESSTLANIAELLATDKAPALEWLRASSETSKRNLGEMETDISIEFVQAQHDLGAAAVLAVRITDTYGCDDQTSNDIVIQLPSDPDSRARLFSFARSHATDLGFDPEPDFGQSHLWLWLC
jgi:hypothetical protein